MFASTLALALACAAPLAAPVAVGLSLQPAVGLTDDEVAVVHQKIKDDLNALGVTVVEGPAVDPACVADGACVEAARAAAQAPPAGLLVVELVRIGPVVQVSLTGAAGERQVVSSESLDEQRMGEGRFLSESVHAWVQGLVPVPEETVASVAVPAAPEQRPGGARIGALAAGGVGVLAAVTGAALVALGEQTLSDPKSSGADKVDATTLGWAGVASLGVGVVGVAVAVGLFVIE